MISGATDKVLSAENLSASYNKKQVLYGINTSFSDSNFYCIIGKNGSGKSTFLELLSGVSVPTLKITAGKCCLDGKNIKSFKSRELAKNISFLPQNETYAWNYQVFDAIKAGRYAHSKNPFFYEPDDNSKVIEAMEKIGITELMDRYIYELSGGEMQQVLIARALTQEAKIIILDEPFSHLDIGLQFKLMKMLKDLAHQNGITVIMSLHEINLSPVYADRLLLFSEGKLLADGNVEDVFTEEKLSEAFSAKLRIFKHPYLNAPQVFVEG